MDIGIFLRQLLCCSNAGVVPQICVSNTHVTYIQTIQNVPIIIECIQQSINVIFFSFPSQVRFD